LNRFRILQVFQCGECLHKFTPAAGKNKTYPPRAILETVSTYNLGNSISDTQRTIRKRLHVDIPEGTIRSWIRAHKPLTAYARLRAIGRKLFDSDAMIRSYLLRHKQVYRFQLHRAKLELLFQNARHRHLAPAKHYLEAIGEDFPHSIFQTTEHRSSKFPTKLAIPITRKENYATRLAALVLPTAATNKKRHETLQRFMLVNDSATTVTVDLRSTSKMISLRVTSTFYRSVMGICRSSITNPTPGRRSTLTSNLRSMPSRLLAGLIFRLRTSNVHGSTRKIISNSFLYRGSTGQRRDRRLRALHPCTEQFEQENKNDKP
jgi:hypothetical protein